jgi:hypothetical protein
VHIAAKIAPIMAMRDDSVLRQETKIESLREVLVGTRRGQSAEITEAKDKLVELEEVLKNAGAAGEAAAERHTDALVMHADKLFDIIISQKLITARTKSNMEGQADAIKRAMRTYIHQEMSRKF